MQRRWLHRLLKAHSSQADSAGRVEVWTDVHVYVVVVEDPGTLVLLVNAKVHGLWSQACVR